MHAEWVTVQALKKPYPGAPLPPVTMGSKGFNVGSSGQDFQARIPQFFNFVGSNVGNEHAVNKTPVNLSATTSMKSKSPPESTPELQKRPGWYWSETEREWYKTGETLDKERASRLSSIIEEDSSTISIEEEARIRAEVRAVMNKKFTVGRAKLEGNPVAQNEVFVKSGAATSDVDVIDLISQSVASLQKSQPTIIPGSPISVASTPSHAGNGGSAPGFSHLSSGSHPSPLTQPFATMHWKLKEPPCFFGHSSEDVHTWRSLVLHYLTFMGGSDAQQVAYSVTLLHESAHD